MYLVLQEYGPEDSEKKSLTWDQEVESHTSQHGATTSRHEQCAETSIIIWNLVKRVPQMPSILPSGIHTVDQKVQRASDMLIWETAAEELRGKKPEKQKISKHIIYIVLIFGM